MKINVYNLAGQVTGEQELDSTVFGAAIKPELVHFAATGLLNNQRQVLAHTKTRGEVSGGGKKPWKQKHTGRARQGSIRSPLWKGGGVVFGPRSDRNFKVKINKKIKQMAMRMVLSDKVKGNALLLLENFDLNEAKTKVFAKILKGLPIVGKKFLLIFANESANLRRASRNLPKAQSINLCEVNLVDLLNNDTVITSKEAIDYWQKVYAKPL